MIQRPKRSGFTLVELLVVIGIIGLLISILLPAVKKVQVAARGAKCLANLKNLSNNESIYMASHHGQMTMDSTQGLFTSNARTPRGTTYDPRLGTCPEFAMKLPLDTFLAGYAWSTWCTSPITNKPINITRVKNSSETAIFGDVFFLAKQGSINPAGLDYSADGLNDPFSLRSSKSIALLARPSFQGRHGRAGAVLWLDGHASLEQPVIIPSDPARFYTNYLGLSVSIDAYRSANVGYLAKTADDLTSLNGVYYFVPDKATLGSNDPAAVAKQ